MRVRLWTVWPAEGRLCLPGEEVEVTAAEGASICDVGAGEPVRELGGELAVAVISERGVTRRQRGRARG